MLSTAMCVLGLNMNLTSEMYSPPAFAPPAQVPVLSFGRHRWQRLTKANKKKRNYENVAHVKSIRDCTGNYATGLIHELPFTHFWKFCVEVFPVT